ncbi:MAG: AAA family ATPase [Chitinispirillaceae bacterium]|nr:AAA family ATPase [Chitinispirillaceae bacterium]
MGERENKALIFADTDNGGIIHIANIKGGVGKSTVATNLAASLSKRGPALVIDLDVQGSATVALGKETDPQSGTSWDLFRKRYTVDESSEKKWHRKYIGLIKKKLHPKAVEVLFDTDVKKIIVGIQPGLDLIPAGSGLFKMPSNTHISNLLHNVNSLRVYYKYIILDTPSVWNPLTRSLFFHSDLNLIPVTLNALSTKSLKEYLANVQKLAHRFSGIRIRIVKNEVFGKADSKVVGKTRTMNENRRYLEKLCEQVVFKSNNGVSLLPQSIMFDLEIPESAIIRNAQDEGIPVANYKQYGAITRAFDELAKRVQYVLNTPVRKNVHFFQSPVWNGASRLAAAGLFFAILGSNPAVESFSIPRTFAPQQLVVPDGGVYSHTFKNGENIYRVAKYAICRFKAIVPSPEEIDAYIKETVSIYNLTRLSDEPRIKNTYNIPVGLKVTFYPPQSINNSQERQMVKVYRYFNGLVSDPLAYVTGDWCERGTGGGQPHYGIDVATELGAKVLSPMDGEIVVTSSINGGRTIGVVNDNMIVTFSHLDKRFFSTGMHVKAGQALGTIGMTGRTSGPHVHIGYGVRTQTRSDLVFGKYTYRLTDPKLYFYRKMYLEEVSKD